MTTRLFTGALLVDASADQPRPGTLLTRGDTIAALNPADPPADAERVDCGGQWLIPGLIDIGVFATDKPAFHFGGITRAALMPDGAPILDDPALVERAAKAGKPDLWVHPLAAATRGLAGGELAEMALMQRAGARAVATGRHWIADAGVMARVLAYAAGLDMVVVVHGEDGGLTRHAAATSGEIATRLGLPAAPAIAEALAVARDIMLAEHAGAAVHFRQITTAAAFDLVRAAKARGVRVTCGITPAHLLLDELAIGDYRSFSRLSPPLRCAADRAAAIAALADGTIDIIASGHDPRGPEDKRLPFAEAAPGMAGAESLLALALAAGREAALPPGQIIARLTAAPARLLGVAAGMLTPGHAADLALVAPGQPWRIDARKMAAAAGNTPFDGLPTEGRVTGLWKGGERRR